MSEVVERTELIVPGPAEAARARGTPTAGGGLTCDYRLVSPLFDRQGLIARATLDHGRVRTAIRDLTGRQVVHDTITKP